VRLQIWFDPIVHSSIPLWQQPLHFWVHKTFARSFNTADLYFSMKRRLKDTRHDKNLRIPYLLQRLPIVNKKSRSHVCTILLIRILEISDWDIWPLISYLSIWSKTWFTVWPEPIWIKVKKSWLLLPQHQSMYIRGFTNFEITVACGLEFHWYLRTLSLKFQNARTKIEVRLSLPCWLSQFSLLKF
jgi:hypothetical protein